MSHDFPRNIRELENIIERTCIFSEKKILSLTMNSLGLKKDLILLKNN